MNSPRDPFSTELGRLLDDAAGHYHPTPDVARLQRMLGNGGARRRGAVILFSAAASMAVLGGAAWAALGSGPTDDGRIAPAGNAAPTEPTKSTRPDLEPAPTTAPKPEGDAPAATPKPEHTEPAQPPAVEPPKPTEPTGPKPTEPTAAKPTEPTHTEPKPTAPPSTEPKPTAPPTTAPKTTEPPTTEPEKPPVEYEWSAFQTYGECDAAPPYDVFYGTAAPGAKIVVEAAYGRAIGYANEKGHWEVRIEFPEAPVGEPFQVWVATHGHVDDFWFVRTA